jgi:hypothetical protein
LCHQRVERIGRDSAIGKRPRGKQRHRFDPRVGQSGEEPAHFVRCLAKVFANRFAGEQYVLTKSGDVRRAGNERVRLVQ